MLENDTEKFPIVVQSNKGVIQRIKHNITYLT